ncbi:glycosyltransferase family 1 protein, partial [bacterium]|nr:glycosyltransferase family 1 protein [bacterium]
FEIPACGGCCVVEDTQEHRVMFGSDGEAVLYFSKPEELAGRVREAFANPELRSKLRKNVHKLITERPNTYADRLRSILEAVEENSRKATKDAKKISFGESGKK